MSSMDQLKLQLEEFGQARNVPELVRFGQPFLKTAAAAKAAKSQAFKDGLRTLAESFSDEDAEHRLQAMAFAWRVTSVTSMRDHRRYVIDRLSDPAPEPDILPTGLPDPDDRKNLAEALRWKHDDWIVAYIIRSIANEKDGKQARSTLCDSLLIKQPNLSLIFEALATELRSLKLGQKDEILGRARQLTNILVAFSDAVWSSPNDFEVGESFGFAYSKLIGSVADAGEISERSVKIGLAKSAVELYITLSRLRPALTANSASYAFIKAVKRIFAPADWPADLYKTIDVLAKQVGEQLVFMLQLDHADKDLRNLFLFLKGQVAGQSALKKLADSAERVSPDNRFWLQHGKGRKTLATEDAIGESALSQFDLDIAYLMREVDSLVEMSAETNRAFENESDLMPTATISRVRQFFGSSDDVARRATSLFEKRGLSVRGRIGETVEFNPSEHDPSEDAIGEKVVRISRKLVEREIGGGKKTIVLKAEVQKP